MELANEIYYFSISDRRKLLVENSKTEFVDLFALKRGDVHVFEAGGALSICMENPRLFWRLMKGAFPI